jgi:hypothetical protein
VRRNFGKALGSWCHCAAVRRNLDFRFCRECQDILFGNFGNQWDPGS